MSNINVLVTSGLGKCANHMPFSDLVNQCQDALIPIIQGVVGDTGGQILFEYTIAPCPAVYPLRLLTDPADPGTCISIADEAALVAWLASNHPELSYDPLTCTISGTVDEGSEPGFEISGASFFTWEYCNAAAVGVEIRTENGSTVTVDWGDGSPTETIQGDRTPITHNYGSTSGTATFTVDDICDVVTELELNGAWCGDINQMPSTLIVFQAVPGNGAPNNTAVTGDIAVAFASTSGLEIFSALGANTLSGDIAAAFANATGLLQWNTQGQNTISGDIAVAFASVPGLIQYTNYGQNTVTGDIAAALASTPGLTQFLTLGQNTISGDIAAAFASTPGLTQYRNSGQNTTLGDIAAAFASVPGLILFDSIGQNTISGNIAAAFASVPGLVFFQLSGQNTTSGVLAPAFASVPNLTTFINQGQNTTTGDLALAFAANGNVSFYLNIGQNTTFGNIGIGNLTASPRYFLSRPVAPGHNSAEVDAILIDLATYTWAAPKILNLTGSSQPPTPASAAAITTLTGMGVTVVTN